MFANNKTQAEKAKMNGPAELRAAHWFKYGPMLYKEKAHHKFTNWRVRECSHPGRSMKSIHRFKSGLAFRSSPISETSINTSTSSPQVYYLLPFLNKILETKAKMGRDRSSALLEKRELSGGGEEEAVAPSKRNSRRGRDDSFSESDSGEDRSRSRRKARESSEPEGKRGGKLESRKRKSRSRYSSEDDSDSDSESEDSGSESEESGLDSDSKSESEGERKRRKRRERKRREEERERKRRRKEKEKRRKKEKEEEKKRKEKRKKKQKEKKERGKKGPVTNLWGKYGIIRETDMWTKRPEFTAWLAEVKQVNLESLANWEEKQMFKEFMEDHNTATFPSKKYYNLDAYYRRQMEKEQKRGVKKILQSERTVFNDEEQRRQELMREREKQKAEEVETLKRSMQSGMAQAMKEQAQLREEMAYQYKIGNFEAAAAIQRRLDPDVAM